MITGAGCAPSRFSQVESYGDSSCPRYGEKSVVCKTPLLHQDSTLHSSIIATFRLRMMRFDDNRCGCVRCVCDTESRSVPVRRSPGCVHPTLLHTHSRPHPTRPHMGSVLAVWRTCGWEKAHSQSAGKNEKLIILSIW